MPNYLDAERFTRLFKNNTGNRNRRRIAADLHTLAQHAARRFQKFRPIEQDLQDAASEATLIAIRKIDRFDPRRGTSAFSYFSTVVIRAIARHLKRQHQRRCREMGLPA